MRALPTGHRYLGQLSNRLAVLKDESSAHESNYCRAKIELSQESAHARRAAEIALTVNADPDELYASTMRAHSGKEPRQALLSEVCGLHMQAALAIAHATILQGQAAQA